MITWLVTKYLLSENFLCLATLTKCWGPFQNHGLGLPSCLGSVSRFENVPFKYKTSQSDIATAAFEALAMALIKTHCRLFKTYMAVTEDYSIVVSIHSPNQWCILPLY